MLSKKSTKISPIYLQENQRIDQLPGYMFPPGCIIEKRYTGIGATQSEIKALRHSIIVFPSRSIAYNKSLSNKGTFYVGSLPEKKKIRNEDIRNYYQNPNVKFKKFLVVANSLPRLFSVLGESTIYKDFFLLFDEIDKFQGESTFRTELEDCLDYYNPAICKGCLVSATVGSFSNKILDNLIRISVELKNPKKPPVTLYRIDHLEHVDKFLFHKIQQYPNDKFLIAHKSIKVIKKIINRLDLTTRRDTKVLCSESSSEQIAHFYDTLHKDSLPGRINFMTAAYFSGVDIQEDFHLVILSDNSTSFSLLTISEIRQLVGRCRRKLLSTDILIPQKQNDIKLLKRSDLVQVAKEALANARPYHDTLRSLKLDEDTIINNRRAQALLTFNNVLLLRVDKNDKLRISYFTIDQYWNSNKELRMLYSQRRYPLKSLGQYFSVKLGKDEFSGLDFTEDYRKSFLNSIIADRNSKESLAITKDEKKVFARYRLCDLLPDPTDHEWIIEQRFLNSRSFKKEYIIRYLRKLLEMHPLWESMISCFEVGESYTDEDVKKKIEEALKNYDDEIISISSADYISVLSSFFNVTKTTSQKRNGFKINSVKETHDRFSVVERSQKFIEDHKRYWENS